MKIPCDCDDLVPRTPKALCDPVLVKAWDEFMELYPRKKDCLDEIVRMIVDSGLLSCGECQTTTWETQDERSLCCSGCNTTCSATAKTFFHHMRSPRAWLAAIWFTERGIMLSSTSFQKLLNIAYSSARAILNRVLTAMRAPMQNDPETMQVSTSELMGLFRRRSSETPARQSPKAEEESLTSDLAAAASRSQMQSIESGERDRPNIPLRVDLEGGAASETELESSRETQPNLMVEQLPDEQRLLLDLIIDQSLNSDQLASKTGLPIGQVNACLSILEMDELCVRLPGNNFCSSHLLGNGQMSALKSLSNEEANSVKIASLFVDDKYKGVSRKHLQIYLVAHWCSIRKRTEHSQTVIAACLKLGKKTTKEIFSQVTEKVVRIWKAGLVAA